MLFWHYQHFTFVADVPVGFQRTLQPFYSLAALLFEYGNHGVEIFWCVSGFIFFWKYRDSIAAGVISAPRFAVLRLSRLYPLHLVTLVAVAALQPVYHAITGAYFVYQDNDLPHFVAQLFLATDWGILDGYSFNGPIWSVSIEVFLYVFFFGWVKLTGGRLAYLLPLVALAAITHAAHLLPYQLSKGLLFFFLGGATAHLHQLAVRHHALARAVDWSAVVTLASVALALGLATVGRIPPLHPTVVLLVCTPSILILVVRHVTLEGASARLADQAGSITYASYLLHFPLQLGIVVAFRAVSAPIPFHHPAFFGAFMTITLLLSRVVYRHFEMPAQTAIRRRFSGPPKATG